MLRLIEQDASVLEALGSAEQFERTYGADASTHLEDARDATSQTLQMMDRLSAKSPWGGYLAVDEGSHQVVGVCAFKGSPGADGRVEIAYFTFPAFERRGVATEMANLLFIMAARHDEVRTVIAYTLPETNASTSVLRKNGFRLVGEVEDPEDGLVWLWERSANS